MLAVVAAAAAWALYRDHRAFVSTYRRIGPAPVVVSFAFGLVGVGATFPQWRDILAGLGVDLPWGDGSRVFFTSQLGKYLPGSVWPALLQMEAGRRRGAARATMLWANLASLVVSCAVGLTVASVLLPAYDAAALRRYWWGLLAIPFLLAALHPRVLPWAMDRALRLLRRPPLHQEVDFARELRAGGWSLLSWLALGAHLASLVAGSGPVGFAPVALAVGGMALAVPLGILFIPAPAGAGVRDVVLVLVLRSTMASGPALAVVVGSRVLLVLCDLVLAAVVNLAFLRAGRRAPAGGRPAGPMAGG